MNILEISAVTNLVHKVVAIRNWWRSKVRLTSRSNDVASMTKETVRFPVLILPQNLNLVNLANLTVDVEKPNFSHLFKGFSVNCELEVRRVEAVEITLIFTHAKHLYGSRKLFYVSVNTSNVAGAFKERKEFPEEYINPESHIALAYISHIEYRDDIEPWSVEGEEDKLMNDTFSGLEMVILNNWR